MAVSVKCLTPTLWGIPRTGLICAVCGEATVFEQDVLLSSERATETLIVASGKRRLTSPASRKCRRSCSSASLPRRCAHHLGRRLDAAWHHEGRQPTVLRGRPAVSPERFMHLVILCLVAALLFVLLLRVWPA